MTFDPISFLATKCAELVATHGWKAQKEYRAKGQSLKTYPKTLRNTYGELKIQGLSGCNSIDPLDMFVDRTGVEYLNIDLLEEDRLDDEYSNIDPLEEEQLDDESKKSKSVLDILNNHQRLVILGEPGSGKSTLIQYLALNWAKWWEEKERDRLWGQRSTIESYIKLLEGKKDKQFPIIIELGEYARYRKDGESFREFWYSDLASDQKFDKDNITELNNENILVIFDGLNEIEDRRLYSHIIRKIKTFASKNGKTRIVVTCREINDDNRALKHVGFSHFKLEDFDNSQQDEFIHKWVTKRKEKSAKKKPEKKQPKKEDDPHETHMEKKERIIKENEEKITKEKERLSRETQRFTSIAGKPQLLMIMLGILDTQDSLPNEKELYALLLRTLLDSFNENGIDRRERQIILGLIAYKMQFDSHDLNLKGNSIEYESLRQLLINHLDSRKFIDPRSVAVKIIEELKSARFINCVSKNLDSEDIYSFVNPKLLTYFCAKEVKRKFKISSSTKPNNSFEIVLHDIFRDYCRDEDRHESLRLICGVLDKEPALKLVSLLMNLSVDRVDYLDEKNLATKAAIQHLWLARECITEIKD
jgi:predicted NACHT family NTPase